MQAPGGPEEDDSDGFAYGGWSVNYWDEEMDQAMDEVVSKPFAMVLGRRTYDIMAAFWPHASEEEGAACVQRGDQICRLAESAHAGLEQLAFSSRENRRRGPRCPQGRGWAGAAGAWQRESGSDADTPQSGRPSSACGSSRSSIGSGKRLFGEGTIPSGLELIEGRTSTTGVFMGTYRSAGEIVTGTFGSD